MPKKSSKIGRRAHLSLGCSYGASNNYEVLKMIQWFQLQVASFKIAAGLNDSRQLTSSKTANRFAHSDALIARPF